MIPLNMMPFMTQYWPYFLAGLMFYTVFKLALERTQQQGKRQERENKKSKRSEAADKESDKDLKQKRKEAADVSDESDDDQGVAPSYEECAFIPYKRDNFSEDEMVQRSQDHLEFMNKRRTLRFFSDKPVPKKVMDNIILAAGTAPSGAHTEPWTYVVVTDQSIKEDIRKIVEDEEEVNYAKRMGEQWVQNLSRLKTDWVKPYLTEAPYIVLLFKQSFGVTDKGVKTTNYYNEISTSISAGLFIAAVHNVGLVTLTSTPLNCGPALRELLGRPKNEKLLFLLPVGYPTEDATVPDMKRKALKDIAVFM